MALRRGLALIIVVGILGVLAVLAVSFVLMAQLERRASAQRVNAARAYLLARSGIEDALARLALGQDASYGGEDWRLDGDQGAGSFDRQQEVYHPGVLDVEACPPRHALRPSFFVGDGFVPPRPALMTVDGRQRGYSGLLAGDHATRGNAYALKVEDLNAGIHVNGGDGGHDSSPEGPNGFLVRLLDNLDAVVTNGATSDLGALVVGARPAGGYASLDGLPGRARLFKGYLSLHAWVDPTVVKPQPVDGRPFRFQDIDDAHRLGGPAEEIAGVKAAGTAIRLLPGGPWNQEVAFSNPWEGSRRYSLRWERDDVYAWHQLRLAPPAREPRAPVAVNAAPWEVLAAVFLGLRGTALEAWDGSAGWDGGFGWCLGDAGYPYPSGATEETPWMRTRLDYGMTYGTSSRPWYGPGSYSPADPSAGQLPIQTGPLGRLKETPAITLPQAGALAEGIRRRVRETGPFRTWTGFNAFVEGLPRWEDLDGDGKLDGDPYSVEGKKWKDGFGVTHTDRYTRRIYRREDLDSDGSMALETFPGGARGLTFLQKDAVKAMANPNTDLNDFNPDANLFKEVDKTDLLDHTTELALDAAGPAAIRSLGRVVAGNGRLLGRRQIGIIVRMADLLRHTTQADFMRDRPLPEVFSLDPLGVGAPYPLAQPLVGYPEPRTLAGGARAPAAEYDGQVSLGFVGSLPGPDETIRGDLFDTADATGALPADPAAPDLRGPLHAPLLGVPEAGSVFPDGVYSEKDRALKYPVLLNFLERPIVSGIAMPVTFYVACWVKPNWLPEASPRPHALISLTRGILPHGGDNAMGVSSGNGPLNGNQARPVGLYFAPARNNAWEGAMGTYAHGASSARGTAWPRRSLVWGTTHSLFASDCLNRRGIETPPAGPVARLEGRRWQHVAVMAQAGNLMAGQLPSVWGSRVFLGSRRASADPDGGGWNYGFADQHDPGDSPVTFMRVYPDREHFPSIFINVPVPDPGYADRRFEHAVIRATHDQDGTPNHLRFGEVTGEHVMNYAADATFANVRAGCAALGPVYDAYFGVPTGPGVLGRYLKEDGATYASPPLPPGLRPVRATWTEIPCALWFDRTGPDGIPDGWLDSLEDDRNGNGKRDVRIDLEIWDDGGLLARFDDPAADNRIPPSVGRLYYKAVFVNEWDALTRLNHPLDVTPFLDDVTFHCTKPGGPALLRWGADDAG